MAEVTYVSGPRVERVMGSDRRYTGEERIVLGIAYGKHQTMQLADLTERDLIRIASGALDMLDKLRRERENEEP
jgi:hypothetical protein